MHCGDRPRPRYGVSVYVIIKMSLRISGHPCISDIYWSIGKFNLNTQVWSRPKRTVYSMFLKTKSL